MATSDSKESDSNIINRWQYRPIAPAMGHGELLLCFYLPTGEFNMKIQRFKLFVSFVSIHFFNHQERKVVVLI